MTLRATLTTVLGAAAVALAGGITVAANGTEFFDASHDGEILLYYYGNVRDTKGAVVDKFTVTVTATNLIDEYSKKPRQFPFRNDVPGHFRSPDVGRAIKESGKPVDPRFIEVKITKPGYRVAKAPKVPDKQGAVLLDGWILEPVPGGK
jgi:hypothetical protein